MTFEYFTWIDAIDVTLEVSAIDEYDCDSLDEIEEFDDYDDYDQVIAELEDF